mgnify:CR=1 FL=1
MNSYKEKTIGDKVKDVLKVCAFLYVTSGACYMWGQDVTGHYSADLATGRLKPSKLDRMIMDNGTKLLENLFGIDKEGSKWK